MINPIWAVLIPLCVVPLIIFFGEKNRNLREASIIFAGIILLLLNIHFYQSFIRDIDIASGRFTLFANLDVFLSLEPLGLLFLLVDVL